MEELGILFNYHKNDSNTRNNLASLNKHNKDLPVFGISTDQIIPGSSHISDYGKLGTVWGECKNKWTNCDIPFFGWYATQKKVDCKRWMIVEHDVYCDMDLHEFCNPTKNYDMVSSTIPIMTRETTWPWFKDIPKLPRPIQPFSCGVMPLPGTIISDELMKKLTDFYLNKFIKNVFCELRVASIANYLGHTPVPNCHPAARNITWTGRDPLFVPGPGIWHPIKHNNTNPEA